MSMCLREQVEVLSDECPQDFVDIVHGSVVECVGVVLSSVPYGGEGMRDEVHDWNTCKITDSILRKLNQLEQVKQTAINTCQGKLRSSRLIEPSLMLHRLKASGL